MKTIVEINSVNHGSTGTIMRNIALAGEKKGFTIYTSCQRAKSTQGEKYHRHLYIGNRIDRNIHLCLGRMTGKYGLYSSFITRKFLIELDKIHPDIIHIHNLHKGYINFEILFDYIKQNNIPVVWTLHDCWSFTGQCPHFERVGCRKWVTGCGQCPSYKEYPSNIDCTKFMYEKKRESFLGVKDLTIVTPSIWLSKLVRKSFLKDYPVRVINNGIDLSIFKPRKSDIRKQYGIEDKIIVLGVASIWNVRKGLDVFIRLSKELDDKYQIILIGLKQEQIDRLPSNVIGIERINDTHQLAEFYSAADVFFNPTVEDNFPTVNIEALACGTPVITFPTGGSAECIVEGCGMIVTEENVKDFIENISVCSFDRDRCAQVGLSYSASDKYAEYVQLYEEIVRRYEK